ncbi:hypothetical protein AB3R30_12190 [Leptolyngbyaceae cyanobacterium UHCC 1019]
MQSYPYGDRNLLQWKYEQCGITITSSHVRSVLSVLERTLDRHSLAAGVAAPLGILLSPTMGAILMSVSTVVVSIKAMLLRHVRLS